MVSARKVLTVGKLLRRAGFQLAVGALLLLAACDSVDTAAVPAAPFPVPDGEWSVGTTEFDWIDSAREDPFAGAGVPRRLTVQVWYPSTSSGEPAPYLMRPSEYADASAAVLGRNVRTNATLDAPLAQADRPFPVVLYNHGFQATRWSATFMVETLASHGYVVVAPEYFGPGSSTVRYLDGTKVKKSTLSLPRQTGELVADTEAFKSYLSGIVVAWTTDAQFVLDEVSRLNQGQGQFAGQLDLSRTGVIGTSLGGAVALQLASVDPKIDAAVNFDGTAFGSVKTNGAQAAMMVFHHDLSNEVASAPAEYRKEAEAALAELFSDFAAIRDKSVGDWYEVSIPNSQHLDFSDYSLFEPPGERAASLAPAALVHDIIRIRTLTFLDCYLKDVGCDSPMLAPSNDETIMVDVLIRQ